MPSVVEFLRRPQSKIIQDLRVFWRSVCELSADKLENQN